MPTTTNRPFFLNFFAAFRAHPAYQTKPSASGTASSSSASITASSHQLTTKSNASSPGQTTSSAAITPSSPSAATASVAIQAAASYQHARVQATSPTGRTPGTSPIPQSPPGPTSGLPGGVGAFARSRTPSQTRPSPTPPFFPHNRQQRRSSDSSGSDTGSSVGGQNWYIGGRTTRGEERFYKLGAVKRYSSADRMSVDRLSL